MAHRRGPRRVARTPVGKEPLPGHPLAAFLFHLVRVCVRDEVPAARARHGPPSRGRAMRIAGSRFLVTGGTGFIGSGVVRGLLAGGALVRSLDDDSRGSRRRLADLDSGTRARLELVT